MVKQFLVCRKDAIKIHGGTSTISSSCFPILVDYDCYPGEDIAENIVRKAFDSINEGYVGLHEYIVVPMRDAIVVSFRPKAHYEVTVRSF